MFGRILARVVTSLALVAASVAWMGWIYLHTAADPTRSDRIAHAILDDPRARHEVAVDISNGLASAANKALKSHGLPATVDGADPALESAVEAALAEPAITANLIDAISAEHALALGETPAHPAAIDTALLVSAVRAHLLPVEPGVARAIPLIGPSEIKLPSAKIPYARKLRLWANRWVRLLALGAAAGVLLALLIGDRVVVVRRAGFWAIGAGLTWAVMPRLLAWAGGKWVQSQAAVIRAVLQGATGSVTATATTLAVIGLACVVVSYAAPQLLGVISIGDVPRRRAHRRGTTPPAAPSASAPPLARPLAGTRGASPLRPTAPRTDTWTPHDDTPREAPVVYDKEGRFTAGPARRRGVSRAALGLDAPAAAQAAQAARAPAAPAAPGLGAPFDIELDPTGPLPPITP
jgi:hypothetical protein